MYMLVFFTFICARYICHQQCHYFLSIYIGQSFDSKFESAYGIVYIYIGANPSIINKPIRVKMLTLQHLSARVAVPPTWIKTSQFLDGSAQLTAASTQHTKNPSLSCNCSQPACQSPLSLSRTSPLAVASLPKHFAVPVIDFFDFVGFRV